MVDGVGAVGGGRGGGVVVVCDITIGEFNSFFLRPRGGIAVAVPGKRRLSYVHRFHPVSKTFRRGKRHGHSLDWIWRERGGTQDYISFSKLDFPREPKPDLLPLYLRWKAGGRAGSAISSRFRRQTAYKKNRRVIIKKKKKQKKKKTGG